MKHINTFNKLFVPNIEPGTMTFEEIRLEWSVGLVAMSDLEKEAGLTVDQANETRHQLITRYIEDLHQAKDIGQQNLSMVRLYWEDTIKKAKQVARLLDPSSIVIPSLEYQRDIELELLRFE